MKIGIICTWPWGVKNAESEVILRLKIACENINVGLFCISSDGYLVDDNFNITNEKINEDDLDFIIAMHYEDKKLLDKFTYLTLWNPPEITLQYPEYHIYMSNMRTMDDFLIYNKGEMFKHLQTILGKYKTNEVNNSFLTASFSKNNIIIPKLKNPKLFYCGTNWEVFTQKYGRHQGLFKLLDEQDWIDIYGPNRKKHHPWKGYKRYCGEIPFDGISILNKINECGVCLALSSQMHWNGEAVSSRIYEACASGALVITDDNKFIREHFGDNVLYIDFAPKNYKKMFEQICNHMEWIKSHKEEALQKAINAQNIFKEKFILEKQIANIIENHNYRVKEHNKIYHAINSKAEVASIYYVDEFEFNDDSNKKLKKVIENNLKQVDVDLRLYLACDKKYSTEVQNIANSEKIIVLPYEIYDDNKNRILTRGEILKEILINNEFEYFYINYGDEKLYKDYATSNVRALENNPDNFMVYSFPYYTSSNGRKSYFVNMNLDAEQLCFMDDYSINHVFRKDALKNIDLTYLEFMDSYEAELLIAHLLYNKKMSYTLLERIVYGKDKNISKNNWKYKKEMQFRYIQDLILPNYMSTEYISEFNAKELKKAKKDLKNFENKIAKYKFLMFFMFNSKLKIKYEEKIKKRTNQINRLKKTYKL